MITAEKIREKNEKEVDIVVFEDMSDNYQNQKAKDPFSRKERRKGSNVFITIERTIGNYSNIKNFLKQTSKDVDNI